MKRSESQPDIPPDAFGYEWTESSDHPGISLSQPFAGPAAEHPAKIAESGLFAYEAKSAYHYQDALMVIAGERRVAPIFFRTNCILRTDKDNPLDRNAIEILIAGRPSRLHRPGRQSAARVRIARGGRRRRRSMPRGNSGRGGWTHRETRWFSAEIST